MKMLVPRGVLFVLAVGSIVALTISASAIDALDHSGTLAGSTGNLSLELKPQPKGIWVDDSVGKGFRSGVREAGLSLGGAFATHDLGGVSPQTWCSPGFIAAGC